MGLFYRTRYSKKTLMLQMILNSMALLPLEKVLHMMPLERLNAMLF